MKRLTEAHRQLIRLLAEVAVEQFLDETANTKKESSDDARSNSHK